MKHGIYHQTPKNTAVTKPCDQKTRKKEKNYNNRIHTLSLRIEMKTALSVFLQDQNFDIRN